MILLMKGKEEEEEGKKRREQKTRNIWTFAKDIEDAGWEVTNEVGTFFW